VISLVSESATEDLRRRLVRMACDVHDGPMQELIAMSQRLHKLRKNAVASGPEGSLLGEEFGLLIAHLAETEQMLRSMVFSLEQGAEEQLDLLAIVDEHVGNFKAQAPGVVVSVLTDGVLELHTDSQRIAVSRVLRESLSNIVKHARATRVTIHLQGLSDSLLVRIRDDGDGFEPSRQAREGTKRIGLHAMKERLELIGGRLTVESQPQGPTTITAVIEKWQPNNEQAA
jgi:signal transduction histidine kinase